MLYICIYILEYYPSIKNKVMPFAGKMKLEIIVQNEKSQPQEKKCLMFSLICITSGREKDGKKVDGVLSGKRR